MGQQKESSLVPALAVVSTLLAAASLVALCYYSIEARKVHDREIAANPARQKQAGEISRQEQAIIKRASSLKLLRD